MKWRNSIGRKEDEAQLRHYMETRRLNKFAFLPTKICGDTVWLENYTLVLTWSTCNKHWYINGKEVIV